MVEPRMITQLNHQTTRLGMGLMRLPTKEGRIDEPTALAMIDRLMEAGVRYYDTAWFYHDGRSEPFARKALVDRYPRRDFTIATKLPLDKVETLGDAQAIFQQQRKNLGVETIDFYLLHGIDQSGWEKAVRLGLDRLIRDWKKEGLIGYAGFSFHGVNRELGPILDAYRPDFVQIQLNYYDWFLNDARERYEAARSREIPIFVMGPVRGGGLTWFDKGILDIFAGTKPPASPVSFALRWCASLPSVDVVLSGMSTLAQVEENIQTFQGPTTLTPEEQAVIERVMATYRKLPLIPCTGCNYCSKCPQEIEIARHFVGHNERVSLGASWFLDNYQRLTQPGRRASDCIECRLCEKACPQKIPIVEQLHKLEI